MVNLGKKAGGRIVWEEVAFVLTCQGCPKMYSESDTFQEL